MFVLYLAQNTLHICYDVSFVNGIHEDYYLFSELANTCHSRRTVQFCNIKPELSTSAAAPLRVNNTSSSNDSRKSTVFVLQYVSINRKCFLLRFLLTYYQTHAKVNPPASWLVWQRFWFEFRSCQFRFSFDKSAILTEFSFTFPECRQANSGIAREVRLFPLPSTSLPIQYSLHTLPFDSHCDTLTDYLNKL